MSVSLTMVMDAPYHANAELVLMEWLKMVDGLPSDKISTTLPDDSVIAEEGFVTVQAVGGVPNMYTKMQRSLIQIDCWGYNANSNRLPWGKTYNLAMNIKEATWALNTHVTTPDAFNDARVTAVVIDTDPRRITTDPAYARYSMDVVVHWVELIQ